jgi:ATP diphosphatase
MEQATERPIEQLLAIMARLRDPQGGCPWDLEQDFSTIAPYTIEEAYEVADAIDRNDLPGLKDELGDLLLQVVFHAQMAREQGAFGFDDVAAAISNKMVRRHPHVFGDARFADAEAQTLNWEAIKRAEREAAGEEDRSALAGISRGLPEWQRAVKLQARAARTGFDWPGPEPVIAKLHEEIEEVRAEFDRVGSGEGDVAANQARLQDEIGDLLFVAANLARHAKVDVGAAMRQANLKFERRFRAMEQLAEADGTPLQTLTLEQQDGYWNRAKRIERGQAD